MDRAHPDDHLSYSTSLESWPFCTGWLRIFHPGYSVTGVYHEALARDST